jgi:hypothetical protein
LRKERRWEEGDVDELQRDIDMMRREEERGWRSNSSSGGDGEATARPAGMEKQQLDLNDQVYTLDLGNNLPQKRNSI